MARPDLMSVLDSRAQREPADVILDTVLRLMDTVAAAGGRLRHVQLHPDDWVEVVMSAKGRMAVGFSPGYSWDPGSPGVEYLYGLVVERVPGFKRGEVCVHGGIWRAEPATKPWGTDPAPTAWKTQAGSWGQRLAANFRNPSEPADPGTSYEDYRRLVREQEARDRARFVTGS